MNRLTNRILEISDGNDFSLSEKKHIRKNINNFLFKIILNEEILNKVPLKSAYVNLKEIKGNLITSIKAGVARYKSINTKLSKILNDAKKSINDEDMFSSDYIKCIARIQSQATRLYDEDIDVLKRIYEMRTNGRCDVDDFIFKGRYTITLTDTIYGEFERRLNISHITLNPATKKYFIHMDYSGKKHPFNEILFIPKALIDELIDVHISKDVGKTESSKNTNSERDCPYDLNELLIAGNTESDKFHSLDTIQSFMQKGKLDLNLTTKIKVIGRYARNPSIVMNVTGLSFLTRPAEYEEVGELEAIEEIEPNVSF